MIPAILYHGTGSKHLASIKKHGLRGRKPGSVGNFPKIPSGLGRVYLSDTFALWYAMDGMPRSVMLEIDTSQLDPSCWYPDEDWISAASTTGAEEVSDRRARTLRARECAMQHPELAGESLAAHGTVAYAATIPAQAITGIVAFTSEQLAALVVGGYDPSPGIQAHRILGGRYRAIHRWAFGREDGTVDTGAGPFALPNWTPEAIGMEV